MEAAHACGRSAGPRGRSSGGPSTSRHCRLVAGQAHCQAALERRSGCGRWRRLGRRGHRFLGGHRGGGRGRPRGHESGDVEDAKQHAGCGIRARDAGNQGRQAAADLFAGRRLPRERLDAEGPVDFGRDAGGVHRRVVLQVGEDRRQGHLGRRQVAGLLCVARGHRGSRGLGVPPGGARRADGRRGPRHSREALLREVRSGRGPLCAEAVVVLGGGGREADVLQQREAPRRHVAALGWPGRRGAGHCAGVLRGAGRHRRRAHRDELGGREVAGVRRPQRSRLSSGDQGRRCGH
mmetsp:Transcript_31847/g.84804  ORF Transcript_31847/g.84804 Transcript_31847/m.84804 type:complete len:293 (+) Transcript_31847:332-1210(+)